jgi:hypothetical protein
MKVSTVTLECLRLATQLSSEEWASCLRISTNNYQQQLGQPEILINDRSLENLAEMIDLTPENIVSGNIDFKTVAKRHAGYSTYLPEKYSRFAYSKIRTSSYLLDYVEMVYGWKTRRSILRHFQLNESIFSDLDKQISVQFISDLCLHLTQKGLVLPEFYSIGKYSTISNRNSAVGSLFRELGRPRVAYEKCFTEFIGKYYDQNFVYTLMSLKGTTCVLEARPHQRVLDELHVSTIGNAATCASRGGTFASIMGYLGAADADVIESSCIHKGDAHCIYVIDFEKAERILSSGLSA